MLVVVFYRSACCLDLIFLEKVLTYSIRCSCHRTWWSIMLIGGLVLWFSITRLRRLIIKFFSFSIELIDSLCLYATVVFLPNQNYNRMHSYVHSLNLEIIFLSSHTKKKTMSHSFLLLDLNLHLEVQKSLSFEHILNI